MEMNNNNADVDTVDVSNLEEQIFSDMLEALEQVDPDERREHDQASEAAPELVMAETRFIDFLRAKDFDCAQAAVGLCRYWKYRKMLFGDDKWLLPMNQTGHGALNELDIAMVRSGWMTFLPRPNQGPIITFDISRITDIIEQHQQAAATTTPDGNNDIVELLKVSKLRVAYYFFTIYAEQASHVDGVTYCDIVTSARRPLSPLLPPRVLLPAITGLPIHPMRHLFVIQSYEPGKERLIDFLGQMQYKTERFQYGDRLPLSLVKADSVQQTVTLVQVQVGMQREYIPTELGGTFHVKDRLAQWVRQRLSVENLVTLGRTTTSRPLLLSTAAAEMSASNHHYHNNNNFDYFYDDNDVDNLNDGALVAVARKPPPHAAAASLAATTTTTTNSTITKMAAKPPPPAAAAAAAPVAREKTSTKKKMPYMGTNARRNVVIAAMKKQIDDLTSQNKAIRLENRRLEEHLAKARLMAAVASSLSSVLGTTMTTTTGSNDGSRTNNDDNNRSSQGS